ncbi:efflux RND transporter periplasmic adaptor subunit [Nodosilinea nodulosa]|uniref:efflux RND transporter periplasmic adaptor subunit n=1 Tax=Nodosilinea nodulosa TaxID=416001 RepID=UPI00036B3D5C|nr:efflux RND transporter periplasmic adaptor subunit [Nodosilinea nodulosa]
MVRQDITINVSASGTVQPITPVNISPKQAGRLVHLYVDQGSRVKAGQVLAQMDDGDLRGQLMQAQGNLAAAQANLRKLKAGNRPQAIQQAAQNLQQAQDQLIAARSTYESNSQLYKSGAISRNDYDISLSQYKAAQANIGALEQALSLQQAGYLPDDIDAARAQVQQAQGSLETIQTQLNDTVIRAPFAGMVTQKYADVGAFVTPTTSASATTSATSSSILSLADDLEALVSVSESDIRNIHTGQPVELQVDAYPGVTFKGEVRLVAPEAVVVQNVTSFQVRIKILDDEKHQLKSGMNLTASFLVGEHKGALLVPTTAVVSQANGAGVYLQQGQGDPAIQPITIGATVGTQTEVLSGLKEGDRVFITFPGQRQPNGQPVKPPAFGGGSGRPAHQRS